MTIQDAVDRVNQFKAGSITNKIKQAQHDLADTQIADIETINQAFGVDRELLAAVAEVKRASAQIDVVIHAAGILYVLPYILEESEIVQSVSLGADNAKSPFDLVTDRRIAEFKFIHWQNKGNAVREKTLFQDFFRLARKETEKKKYLYLLGIETAKRFLEGDRNILKVLDRDRRLADDFADWYVSTYRTVGEYFAAHKDNVHLVDLIKDENIPGIEAFLTSLAVS